MVTTTFRFCVPSFVIIFSFPLSSGVREEKIEEGIISVQEGIRAGSKERDGGYSAKLARGVPIGSDTSDIRTSIQVLDTLNNPEHSIRLRAIGAPITGIRCLVYDQNLALAASQFASRCNGVPVDEKGKPYGYPEILEVVVVTETNDTTVPQPTYSEVFEYVLQQGMESDYDPYTGRCNGTCRNYKSMMYKDNDAVGCSTVRCSKIDSMGGADGFVTVCLFGAATPYDYSRKAYEAGRPCMQNTCPATKPWCDGGMCCNNAPGIQAPSVQLPGYTQNPGLSVPSTSYTPYTNPAYSRPNTPFSNMVPNIPYPAVSFTVGQASQQIPSGSSYYTTPFPNQQVPNSRPYYSPNPSFGRYTGRVPFSPYFGRYSKGSPYYTMYDPYSGYGSFSQYTGYGSNPYGGYGSSGYYPVSTGSMPSYGGSYGSSITSYTCSNTGEYMNQQVYSPVIYQTGPYQNRYPSTSPSFNPNPSLYPNPSSGSYQPYASTYQPYGVSYQPYSTSLYQPPYSNQMAYGNSDVNAAFCYNGNQMVARCPPGQFTWYYHTWTSGGVRNYYVPTGRRGSLQECVYDCALREDCYFATLTNSGNCYLLTTTSPAACRYLSGVHFGPVAEKCTISRPCPSAYKICTYPHCSLISIIKNYCKNGNQQTALAKCRPGFCASGFCTINA